MHVRRAACAAILVTAAATGCSSGAADSKAQERAPKHSSAPAASATAKAEAAPLSLGAGRHWSDTDLDDTHVSGTTTVLSYTQPARDVDLGKEASDFAHPEWAVLEVKVCVDRSSSKVQVAQHPWALGFSDDTRISAPEISGSGVPKPEYPVEGTIVSPGSCLRGKITFSVERGTRPSQIVYAPEGREPIVWAVPKA